MNEEEAAYAAEAREMVRFASQEGRSPAYFASYALASLVPRWWRHRPGHRVGRMRAAEALACIVTDEVTFERLALGMLEDPRVAGLYMRAEDAAVSSGDERKLKTLAGAVSSAVLDNAKVDEAGPVVLAQRDLEAPHLRALESIRRVHEEPFRPDDLGMVLPGTTKRGERVIEAVGEIPDAVGIALNREGLIFVREREQEHTLFGAFPWEVCEVSPWGRTVLGYLHDAEASDRAEPSE